MGGSEKGRWLKGMGGREDGGTDGGRDRQTNDMHEYGLTVSQTDYHSKG